MKRFDASFKHLLEKYPGDWMAFFSRTLGFPTPGAVQVLDADLTTVAVAADKVLQVQGPRPWLLHMEAQASHHHRLPRRMLLYNVLLNHRHRLPVRSVVLLLRPDADRPSLSGEFHCKHPDGPWYLQFRYHVVRLWEVPADLLLQGGLGLLPLAPLADISKVGVETVIRRMKKRVDAEAKSGEIGNIWAATYVLLGLHYPQGWAGHLLRGILTMKESVTYQAIIEEGRAEGILQGKAAGILEGKIEGKIEMLLDLGVLQFGNPPPPTLQAIKAIDDPEYLKLLGKRVLEVSSWEELLATPHAKKRTGRKKSNGGK